MENHKGILVCCTNLIEGMDRAAARRFSWKVQFLPIADEHKVAVYQRYFGQGRGAMMPEETDRVRSLVGLTFGDFKAVQQRFKFKSPSEVTHDRLIESLEAEVQYRVRKETKRIGFDG